MVNNNFKSEYSKLIYFNTRFEYFLELIRLGIIDSTNEYIQLLYKICIRWQAHICKKEIDLDFLNALISEFDSIMFKLFQSIMFKKEV